MRTVDGDNHPVGDSQYLCEGRVWHVRSNPITDTAPSEHHYDYSSIHENWQGDPYRITGDISGVVIDIGGNIGTFAIRALEEGAERVYSYEPEPDNAQVFRLNCAEEIADGRVVFEELAVWSHAYQTVYVDPLYGSTPTLASPGPALIAVPTTDLNHVLAPHAEVDVLKLDTEGAEPAILSTVDPSLLRRVRRVVMEFHGKTPEREQMLVDLASTHELEIEKHGDSGGMVWGVRRND